MFENMRFDIVKKPLFIICKGSIVYRNRAFIELQLANEQSKVTMRKNFDAGIPGDELLVFETDQKTTDYCLIPYRTEEGLFKICIEKAGVSEAFPISIQDKVFIMLETYSGKLFIPIGGGEVFCDKGDIKTSGVNMLISSGMCSEVFADYHCFSRVFDKFSERFSKVLTSYGGKVTRVVRMIDDPTCKFNVFDVDIIMLMSSMMLIRVTGSKDVSIVLESAPDFCTVSACVKVGLYSGRRIRRVSKRFENYEDTYRIAKSIEAFTELYGWKYCCIDGGGELALSLRIPRLDNGGIRFRDSQTEAFDEVGVTDDSIANQLEASLGYCLNN